MKWAYNEFWEDKKELFGFRAEGRDAIEA